MNRIQAVIHNKLCECVGHSFYVLVLINKISSTDFTYLNRRIRKNTQNVHVQENRSTIRNNVENPLGNETTLIAIVIISDRLPSELIFGVMIQLI